MVTKGKKTFSCFVPSPPPRRFFFRSMFSVLEEIGRNGKLAGCVVEPRKTFHVCNIKIPAIAQSCHAAPAPAYDQITLPGSTPEY
jgi:hypothetical protein